MRSTGNLSSNQKLIKDEQDLFYGNMIDLQSNNDGHFIMMSTWKVWSVILFISAIVSSTITFVQFMNFVWFPFPQNCTMTGYKMFPF